MTVKSHMVEKRAGCATVSRLKQQQSASLEPRQLRDAVAKSAKQCQIISCSCNTNTTGVINAKEIHIARSSSVRGAPQPKGSSGGGMMASTHRNLQRAAPLCLHD